MDDQTEAVAADKTALEQFDNWVSALASQVEKKGTMPDIEEAERSAKTTTNAEKQAI